MTISWSSPQPVVPQGKRKPIDVKTAQGEVPEGRFHLYQTREMAKNLRTMWVLYDQETQTQHYLFGVGWDGAEAAAAHRIEKVLTGQFPA